MESEVVQGQPRESVGRKANTRLRKTGLVPAVIYGHNQPPEHVALSAHDLALAIAHRHQMITLAGDVKKDSYLIKAVQYDHFGKDVLHVDLMRVDLQERMTVTVPVVARGEPAGVRDGGLLTTHVSEIDVAGPMSAIPGEVTANVADLAIGDALTAAQVALPDGVAVVQPDTVLFSVTAPREVPEETEAVEGEETDGAEPEVISRGKEEEDGEAES